ncbi:MAG: hybrid sensor histidine kinase/response regulator [Candidatus Melainabacteria bacterium HGW-Melainabacteria-1]|nr:MAG: hybrid sensor histidine kinase/response regulator [Candidatus Melainabacteria bacterium HGW-Melainabacteria-1]
MQELDKETVSAQLAAVEDVKSFLDDLFFHAPVGFAICDPEGRTVTANQEFLRLFGSIPPPEYSILKDEQLENQGFKAMILRSFAGETITTPVFWFDPRDVEHVSVSEGRRVAVSMTTFPLRNRQGQIEYVAATYRDHTEEMLAMQRIEAERDRFRALFASILDGILLMDQSGVMVEGNPAAAQILGLDVADIVTHDLMGLVEAPASLKRDWERFLAQGQLCAETRIQRPDGSVREIEYQFISQFAPGLFLAMLRDVTEQKQLQQEREKLAEQLRQSQKLESIGQLAGGVAHDFNNLLTVINGFSELLLADTIPELSAAEAIQQIYQAGQHAAALTTQLLAFGRKSILQPRQHQLNETVLKLEKMLRRLLREDIEIELRLAEGLNSVLIDPGQFEQVMMNLMLNARDALPDGGLVLIETANILLDQAYDQTHAEIKAGSYVLLTISDNGVGMDETTRQRIFEPFFTSKSEGQGTGLGLSTVHGIVRQSGGHIFVYSELGHGTSFKLYFPSLHGEQRELAATSAVTVLPEGQETVLLVEDVKEVRAFARLVLESCGYHVLEAASGPEAMALFQGQMAAVSLLITDVIMPKMSGTRLAGALQTLNPGLKVLYVSGYTDDAVLRYDILAQGIPFLAKPFTPSQLACKVRDVLDTS